MRKGITIIFLTIVMVLMSVPFRTYGIGVKEDFQKVIDAAPTKEITIEQTDEYVTHESGVWLRNLITWVPRVGAVLFVIGVLISILSNKSNENRKWGLRIAVIESIFAFVVYLLACMAYDKYYFSGEAVQASKISMAMYAAMSRNTASIRNVYYTSINAGAGKAVAILQIFRECFSSVTLPLCVVSIGAAVIIALMAQGRKRIQYWAIIGLGIALPLALSIGSHYII